MHALLIFFLLISICISFLCSILEAVLLSITPAFAERKKQEDPNIGKTLADFQDNIDRPLAAILTLNTIAHTVGAIGVGAQAVAIWGDSPISNIIVPVVMTLAILILSEIIPKTIGAMYWQSLSTFTVKTLKLIIFCVSPLVYLSQLITGVFTKGEKKKSVLSRADFTAMTSLGAKQGVFDEQESSVLKSFLQFHTIRVKDIMTPRTVVVTAAESQSIRKFHDAHRDLKFSRIPIHGKNPDEITGYILRDDLLSGLVDGKDNEPLSSLGRNVTTISEDTLLEDVFAYFTKERAHIAIALDEFGGLAGLVSMEDVIETMLGMEIVDEADDSVDMQALARKQWTQRAKKMGLVSVDS